MRFDAFYRGKFPLGLPALKAGAFSCTHAMDLIYE